MAKRKSAKKKSKKPGKRPRAVADGVEVWCEHTGVDSIESVTPNPNNPNHHPPAQIELLAKIIVGQGWRNPIVVSARSGFITKGHGRLEAARHAGLSEVPVDVQHYDSDAAEWADVLADNRIAELSERDPYAVADIIRDHIPEDFDTSLTGFDQGAIDDLLKFVTEDETITPPDDDNSHTNGDGDPCPYCGQIQKSTDSNK